MIEVAFDDLPESLREMVDVIGFEAMMKLVDTFGGTRIRVPANPRSLHREHPLSQAIGIKAAHQLCEVYAGAEITIPLVAAGMRALRNREIVHLHTEEGWPAHRIARKYRLHEMTIYTILSAFDPSNDAQIQLF